MAGYRTSPLLEQLIQALQCLPGVGPKSAIRCAYHLLERDRESAIHLARALEQAVKHIGHCHRCRNFSETPLCEICRDPKRDQSIVCIVETPTQLAAIDRATHFSGTYYILMGHISPLDGIGPKDLGLDQLEIRLRQGVIHELILAISSTVEGEITAHYLGEMGRALGVRVTRIAQGVPMGGDLETLDSGTLSHAMALRHTY